MSRRRSGGLLFQPALLMAYYRTNTGGNFQPTWDARFYDSDATLLSYYTLNGYISSFSGYSAQGSQRTVYSYKYRGWFGTTISAGSNSISRRLFFFPDGWDGTNISSLPSITFYLYSGASTYNIAAANNVTRVSVYGEYVFAEGYALYHIDTDASGNVSGFTQVNTTGFADTSDNIEGALKTKPFELDGVWYYNANLLGTWQFSDDLSTSPSSIVLPNGINATASQPTATYNERYGYWLYFRDTNVYRSTTLTNDESEWEQISSTLPYPFSTNSAYPGFSGNTSNINDIPYIDGKYRITIKHANYGVCLLSTEDFVTWELWNVGDIDYSEVNNLGSGNIRIYGNKLVLWSSSYSYFAVSEDWGETWTVSNQIAQNITQLGYSSVSDRFYCSTTYSVNASGNVTSIPVIYETDDDYNWQTFTGSVVLFGIRQAQPLPEVLEE